MMIASFFEVFLQVFFMYHFSAFFQFFKILKILSLFLRDENHHFYARRCYWRIDLMSDFFGLKDNNEMSQKAEEGFL